jgi:selenocysteine lyase/cysteine desulfurase
VSEGTGSPVASVARVRAREYPALGPGIFFNAASWGLLPRSAAEEVAGLTLRRNRAGGFDEDEFGLVQRRCRTAAARLIDASAEEIALAPNTSYGVNLAASLVGAGTPGTVLVSEGEFPANVLPWMALEARGFRVELVPVDEGGHPREDELLRRLDRPEVRAVAVSAVQYATGFRADLPTLGRACRDHGVLLCVDAIQALGAGPLSARKAHIDVLATGGQKWLCAPWGSGFAYVRRELWDRFEPPMVSWLGVKGATRFAEGLGYGREWLDDARRFELATPGLQDYLGLARALEIFLEMGLDEARRHIHEVHAPLVEWIRARPRVTAVTPLEPERRAGIFSLRVPHMDRAVDALDEAGVTFAVRERAIRFAPHVYNTVEEMEQVVAILDDVA